MLNSWACGWILIELEKAYNHLVNQTQTKCKHAQVKQQILRQVHQETNLPCPHNKSCIKWTPPVG